MQRQQLAMWRSLTCLIALLVLKAACSTESLEKDRKCGFCYATAEVLSARVQKEKPRNHLDYRGRLDGDGVRFGKVLDFRLSELRIVELLENLSEDLEPYTEVTLAANGPVRWQHANFLTGNKTSTEDSELKYYKRLLKRWSEQVVEDNEEAITEYLRSDAVTPAGIQDLLCTKLSKVCRQAVEENVEL